MRPRVELPSRIRVGDVVEVKTLIPHEMESGLRRDKTSGKPIPRLIVHSMVAQYNGREVFSTRLHGAIASNPYIAFYMKITGQGDLVVTWIDDAQKTWRVRRRIEVA